MLDNGPRAANSGRRTTHDRQSIALDAMSDVPEQPTIMTDGRRSAEQATSAAPSAALRLPNSDGEPIVPMGADHRRHIGRALTLGRWIHED